MLGNRLFLKLEHLHFLQKILSGGQKKMPDTLACSAKFLGKRFGNILAMKNINLKVNGSSASLVANLQLTQLLIYVSLVTHCHLFCLLLFFVFIVCH